MITMSKLRRIVVGYNFSPDGEVALHSARILAERLEAALYLLHVVEPAPLTEQTSFPSLSFQAVVEEIVLKVRTQLKDLAETPEFSRLHTVTDVHMGKPFVEIISVCRRWPGDLIVVGASERGVSRFLGSTAERVLRKAPVPVLIAKRLLTSGPKTLLVPTDFSACAKQAAEKALALARAFGGRVIFLHVIERHTLYPPAYGLAPVLSPISPEMLEPEWQEFLHELPLGDGFAWEKRTREGSAAQTIAEVATEVGADLVVMGTHGRTGLAHMLLGSVTEKVVRSTDRSVLTMRPNGHRFELP
jgi:nucleotide-binding universal stress UspA family protein